MKSIISILISVTALLPAFTAAHGYLCTPPPRGIEKEAYQIDALKSPNFSRAPCRGEGPGKITKVDAGGSLTLDFKITAPHTGPCEVYLLDLDLDLSTQQKIAEKYDCAAVGKVAPWTVKIPAGVSGRKVLRWYWEGRHVGTPGEPYEQCVDLQIGGGGGGEEDHVDKGRPPTTDTPLRRRFPPVAVAASEPASGSAAPTYGGEEQSYGGDDHQSANMKPDVGGDDEEGSYGGDEDDDAKDITSATYSGAPDNTSDDTTTTTNGGCQQGKYVCNQDDGFSICNQNAWVHQSCGAGQVCVPSNGSILCKLASEADEDD
jgi:hypothetical protein